MSDKNYKPVDDGYHNGVKPCYVEIIDDFFNEESSQVKLAFNFGEGFEQPVAKIPLIYAAGHKIAIFENGAKTGERSATEKDQREAFSFLTRVFPAWGEFCKGNHSTEEKLQWFVTHADEVKSQSMDIKVTHKADFASAFVLDPAKSKIKAKPMVIKSSALTRASAAFKVLFGESSNEDKSVVNIGSDDGPLPF